METAARNLPRAAPPPWSNGRSRGPAIPNPRDPGPASNGARRATRPGPRSNGDNGNRRDQNGEEEDGAKKRLLILEDEELIRRIIRANLERYGYDISESEEGSEAIDQYQAALDEGRPFDLMIVDLSIPNGMGGADAVAKIRELDPSVVAIVSSGYSDDPVMAHHEDYGFRAVLPKPYEPAQLAELVARTLEDFPPVSEVMGDLVTLLLAEHTKAQTLKIRDRIGGDRARFARLWELIQSGKPPIPQRAAWVFDHCIRENPALLDAHVEEAIAQLEIPGHPAVHRAILRALSQPDTRLPEDAGHLFDSCLARIGDASQPVAIRAHAMETARKIADPHPELHPELIEVITANQRGTSPAYRARARMVIKRLS